jgi:ribonuclease HII
MDIYRYDESLRQKGFETIAGIDEAGRGPLAGPVVASAVVLPSLVKINGLRDSKKVFGEQNRESIFFDILDCCLDVSVGIIDADEIDRTNILKATQRAMEKAASDLSKRPDLLLIDAVRLPKLDIEQITPIKGESKSASIAAASIVAKVVRDRIMLDYHKLYPEYGFEKHKGYGTKYHIDKLIQYGPCTIHRKTFDKVMSLVLPL